MLDGRRCHPGRSDRQDGVAACSSPENGTALVENSAGPSPRNAPGSALPSFRHRHRPRADALIEQINRFPRRRGVLNGPLRLRPVSLWETRIRPRRAPLIFGGNQPRRRGGLMPHYFSASENMQSPRALPPIPPTRAQKPKAAAISTMGGDCSRHSACLSGSGTFDGAPRSVWCCVDDCISIAPRPGGFNGFQQLGLRARA